MLSCMVYWCSRANKSLDHAGKSQENGTTILSGYRPTGFSLFLDQIDVQKAKRLDSADSKQLST